MGYQNIVFYAMLLIITNEADIHPNPVIDILNARNVPFFRLNTDKLIADYDITWSISDDNQDFLIKYKNAPHSIRFSDITCVWERRPMEPLCTYDPIEDEYVRKAILDEADGFLRYLRYALTYNRDILWIGHPINERRAGSKVLQKLVAREVGFKIPRCVFTNDINALETINDDILAIKPINSYDIPSGEGFLVFYTQKVNRTDIIALGEQGIRNNINFIEQYIPKQYELRVTYINGQFFTARIDSQLQREDEGAIDWRQGYDHNISFVPDETPEELKSKCTQFLEYFDLKFGCFDFIKGLDGEYIFLECNTNGQWLWLEDAGLDISQTLASLFIEQIAKKTN